MDRIQEVHVFERETSSWIFVVRGGASLKDPSNCRPDHLWPEIWIDVSKAAQKKEKQEWAIVKSKLDNARKLRGIYFIDTEDGE